MALIFGGEEPRIRTQGLLHGLDMLISLSAAMEALVLAYHPYGRGFTIDLAFSIALFTIGLYTGSSFKLLLASSLPALVLYKAFGGFTIPLYALSLVRAARIILNMRWFMESSGRFGRQLTVLAIQTILLTTAVVIGGSLALYTSEAWVPGSQIRTLWDALWVVIVTMTTVGYGDIVPVSPLGKLIVGMLMVLGVGIMMYLLSNIANLIEATVRSEIERNLSPKERAKLEIKHMIDIIGELSDEEFEELTRRLSLLRALEAGEKNGLFKIDLEEYENYRKNAYLIPEAAERS